VLALQRASSASSQLRKCDIHTLVWLFYPEAADRTLKDPSAYYRDSLFSIVVDILYATSRGRPEEYANMQKREWIRTINGIMQVATAGALGVRDWETFTEVAARFCR